jgi:hypothetical protein
VADLIYATKHQSLDEIRQWDFDFRPDLNTGRTIASVVATHVPPSGSASTPNDGTPADGIVPVTLGPLAVTGQHQLDVLATLDNGEKSEMLLVIQVDF